MSTDASSYGHWARLQRKALALPGFKSMYRQRIGDIELTQEEAQKLGRIAAGTTLDLDHFKKLNDDYGDGALARVALTLSQFARRSLDMSARLGGEEFALLLYDCDAENARLRLAELVKAVADMKIENRDVERGVLTCSIGSTIVGPGESFGTAYRLADELLYQIKNAGRSNFALAG